MWKTPRGELFAGSGGVTQRGVRTFGGLWSPVGTGELHIEVGHL